MNRNDKCFTKVAELNMQRIDNEGKSYGMGNALNSTGIRTIRGKWSAPFYLQAHYIQLKPELTALRRMDYVERKVNLFETTQLQYTLDVTEYRCSQLQNFIP
jgi:hypothetical protein